ncbi:MAG: hypothetical protein IAF38_17875, partial [Bacteroidia bacterium]|nr:hypothetical protein [Bacteroidia bacterium]
DLDMWLSAGTGIAKDGGPFKPGPDKKTPFPNITNVDYIRVFKTDTLPNLFELKANLMQKTDSVFENKTEIFKTKKTNKKLQHNPDKKVKITDFVTVSVIQLTNQSVSLRVLGITPKDSVKVSFTDREGHVIKQITLTENKEINVLLNGQKRVGFHAEINKQVIDELILMQ